MASESSSFHSPVALFIHVQRAVELNAADPNGRSDPYCVIHLGSPGEQLFKTDVKNGTLNPEWNENYTIQNKQLSPYVFTAGDSIHLYGYLVVDVWDHDTTNPDDFLGRVMIPLGEIPSDRPNESWYPLMKRNTKDGKISGSLKLSTQLLVDETSKIIERDKMSDYVYTKTKSLGFHLSLSSEKTLAELPGKTELVEMAFSRVMIDISSHHCTAQVFLTNFRLIILSTSGHSKSHRYHGRGASIDLSMWIALNNIMSVEMTYNSMVLHRHKSGQRKTRTVSITIHCYDIRVVKLTFIADMDATTLADFTDGKSPEFLASTNSSYQQLEREKEKGTGDGGGVHDRIAQKIKDFATQSPKLLKGTSDKTSKNPRLLHQQQNPGRGTITKSLNSVSVDPIPEESPEHRHLSNGQEDPFEVAEPRGRSRSAAVTQEPKELRASLSVSGNSAKSQSLKRSVAPPPGDESCVSLFSLDKCSNIMDDDFDSDDSYDMLMDEGDSIFFGESVLMDESCTTTASTRVPAEEDGCGSNDDVMATTSSSSSTSSSSVKFPISSSVQLQAFFARLEHLILNTPDFPPAQTFVKKFQGFIQLKGWDFYSFPKEMDRQGVCDAKWSLSVLNGPQYELCSTYPQLMYIPKGIDDQTVVECSKFRSKNRLPSLVWVDKKYHNFMLRCAQPLTGKSGRRSTPDEQLIEAAIKAGPQDGHMFIYDARTFSAATGNKMMGKGTEITAGYPRAKLQYLAIPNIHAVRESYDSLRSLCLSMTSSKWHSSLENTQWLNYLSLILKGSTMIARYMKLQRGNTLVHCSDGWDRTSQLTSLSQLMMDPYYRTMEGFQTLVDKEWLSFGHKFQHRLGHPDHPNDRSPIFFQFLDCVHQIVTQYPTIFEFKLSYLLCIADHLNTAWFGTFMCNCDKERYDLSLYATTASLWAHLIAEKDRFINPGYTFTKQAIFPITNIRRLRLWEEYFLRYDFTTFTLRGGRQVEDNMADHSPSVISHRHSLRGSWTSEAVVWMSDDKTNECCYCQQKFNAFRRKHHCRACGRIFCNDCSKNRMALAHLGYYTPERVCDECYRKLNGAQKSEDGEDEFVVVMTVKP